MVEQNAVQDLVLRLISSIPRNGEIKYYKKRNSLAL